MDLYAFLKALADYRGCGCCSARDINDVNEILATAGSGVQTKACRNCSKGLLWCPHDSLGSGWIECHNSRSESCEYRKPHRRCHECPQCQGTGLVVAGS